MSADTIYRCDFCRGHKERGHIVLGIQYAGSPAIELVDATDSKTHICTTCIEAIRQMPASTTVAKQQIERGEG